MKLRFAVVAIGMLASSASARADLISDEEAVCQGKKKGDACEAGGKTGTCVDSTCGFNDYSNGPPPKRGEKPCLLCDPSAAPAKEATPAKVDEKAKPTAEGGAKADTKSEVPQTKGGCSIDGALGPGSLALGVMLLVLARRARRSGPR
ncbi:MAG TPA: hypothetical protein VG755_40345 [Nannocystaceae bacterium]|nr:hypothetical protein [Nannocystaceae bacterium]